MARRGPMTEEQRRAIGLRARESEARFNAAVARLPRVTAEAMSEDGAINLVAAFWKQVHNELAMKHAPTRQWVAECGDGFVLWCDMSGKADPEGVRSFLLSEVWGNRRYLSNNWAR